MEFFSERVSFVGRGMSILSKFVGACNRQTKHMHAVQGVPGVFVRVYRMRSSGLGICHRLSQIKIAMCQRNFLK